MFSITYSHIRSQFCSILFQFQIQARRDLPLLGFDWNRPEIRKVGGTPLEHEYMAVEIASFNYSSFEPGDVIRCPPGDMFRVLSGVRTLDQEHKIQAGRLRMPRKAI
jgi:hypothetical protein